MCRWLGPPTVFSRVQMYNWSTPYLKTPQASQASHSPSALNPPRQLSKRTGMRLSAWPHAMPMVTRLKARPFRFKHLNMTDIPRRDCDATRPDRRGAIPAPSSRPGTQGQNVKFHLGAQVELYSWRTHSHCQSRQKTSPSRSDVHQNLDTAQTITGWRCDCACRRMALLWTFHEFFREYFSAPRQNSGS